MKKVCITCFEPFDGRDKNISQMVCEIVDAKNVEITKCLLKVSYNKIYDEVKNIMKLDYDLVIMTGEAKSRERLALEKVAINLKSAAIPDNDGDICFNERIDDGSDAYFSNVDVLSLNNKLNELGFDTYVSLSSGSYICNLSYYYGLRLKKNNTKVLFIHYPVKYDKVLDYSKTIEKIIELI